MTERETYDAVVARLVVEIAGHTDDVRLEARAVTAIREAIAWALAEWQNGHKTTCTQWSMVQIVRSGVLKFEDVLDANKSCSCGYDRARRLGE